MKRKFLFLFIFFALITVIGCTKYGENDVIKDFEKKLSKADSYRAVGTLEITNNDDTYQYDVDVAFKKDNNYRVSLINKANSHEQIILKNSEGVYVVTPSLNKSFKFQSEWPKNNSQIYLLESLLEDVKKDKERVFEEVDGNFIFTTKVNYPNNNQLTKQKITLNKDLDIKSVQVLNNNDIPQMIMSFDNIDWDSNFNDNFFDLDSIIEKIDVEDSSIGSNDKDSNEQSSNVEGNDDETIENKTQPSGSIDDIIYPLYIPTGTSLSDQEKVSKTDGERIILTFDGEKPFLLVEETSSIDDEFSVIPTFGEPYLLIDTIGALTDNSITWSSNGIDYYLVSDAMSQLELIEIASSISAIPTMK